MGDGDNGPQLAATSRRKTGLEAPMGLAYLGPMTAETTTTSSFATDAGRPAPSSTTQNRRKKLASVRLWLFVMAGLIAVMVLVGGATRLTDSGLSITEWRPVTGAIPPLSEAAWLSEFEKYKTIPEYEEVNWGMSLDEFKVIYWWEWGHRFLGRLIGLAFAVPFFFFALSGRLNRSLMVKLFGLLLLGGLQGAVGWWMVASGLSERVDVSQYRLAAHLGLALLLFAGVLWVAFDLSDRDQADAVADGWARKVLPASVILAVAVYLQMILGAFVAGLRAGKTFNTWPLMDGKFVPDGYFVSTPRLADMFETMAAVQFNHRLGAYAIAALAVWFFLTARKTALAKRARMVLAVVGVQIVLGIWTVIAATPIWLGLAHQAMALVLLASALYAAHGALIAHGNERAISD